MTTHETDVVSAGEASTPMARRTRMLRSALGPVITNALAQRDVTDVMLNPDGTLWVRRLKSGNEPLGVKLSVLEAERIVRLVAAHANTEVHAAKPLLYAEFPESGERFNAALPPAVPAPAFAIRKHALGVVDLDEYVREGTLSAAQASYLRSCIYQKQNILIAGRTGSGKTTLANALLRVIAETGDRVFTFEDALELQCSSANHVSMRRCPGVTMRDLIAAMLLYLPDRIVIGEVRGGEALDLIKAWGTGHPGGVATIHAGSAHGALTRLEQLIQEVALMPSRALIAEAVNVVVFLGRRGPTRYVEEIARVIGHTADGYLLDHTLSAEHISLPVLPPPETTSSGES